MKSKKTYRIENIVCSVIFVLGWAWLMNWTAFGFLVGICFCIVVMVGMTWAYKDEWRSLYGGI